MALGTDLQYKMTTLFQAVYDEKTAKQIEQQAKETARRAAESSKGEFASAFKSLGTILNSALQKLNIQPIDMDKLIKLPQAEAFNQLGAEFGTKFANGFQGAVASGGGIGASIQEQIKQLESAKAQLLVQQKALPKQLSRYEYLSGLETVEKGDVKAFTLKEIEQMSNGGTANELAANLRAEYDALVNSLDNLDRNTEEYRQTLVKTYEAASNLYQMRSAMDRHPGLVTNQDVLFDYDYDSLQASVGDVLLDGDKSSHSYAFSRFIESQRAQLQSIPDEVQRINQELTRLQQSSPEIVNQKEVGAGLKTLNEIEAAYQRILNAKGKVGVQGKAIDNALNFDPSTSKEGLQALYKTYQNLSTDSPWEVQYQALLKYVKLYESYLNSTNKTHRNKVTAPGNEYSKLYEQLKPMAANAENMLRNVLNLANNQPLVGMGGAEAEKSAEANQQSAVATQNEAEAEERARAASEAKAKADMESAAATEKERLAQEAAAKAAQEKANARRSELMTAMNNLGVIDGETGLEVLDIQTLEKYLSRRKGILEIAQAEGLLTDEIRASYEAGNKAIQERIGLLKQSSSAYTTGSILNNPVFANMFGKATDAAEGKQVANEGSAKAAQEELNVTRQTTLELEKQQKLLLYRRVEGQLDPNRISSNSTDALYNKQNQPIIQSALASGFGGFGDGLYGSVFSAASDLIPPIAEGKVSFFEFDASKYNLFINRTVEQAEALRSFLLSLQKFVGAGSILDASTLTNIADLSQDQLFEEAQKIFSNFSMSKSQFDTWIASARQESEMIADMFSKGQVPTNRHNFGTRFMQALGYDGVLNATGDIDYDGNYHGSVIYDPDIDQIRQGFKEGMRTFANADDFATYLERQATAANNAAQAQEHLNKAKLEEPKPIDDTPQIKNETGAINEQTGAQERLNQAIKGEAYSGTFYHGSKRPFSDITFDPNMGKGMRNVGSGLYYTPDLEQAAKHGQNILKSNLQLDNVFTFTEQFVTDINALYQAMGKIKPPNVDWKTMKSALFDATRTPEKAQEFSKRMLEMGYQAMYTKGYGYADPNTEQLAIYDDKYYKNLTTQPYQEIVNSINAVTQAQEHLNKVEQQNPPAQDEAGVHNANADAINAEVQAQERLNATEGQNPVAQDDTGAHNANTDAIEKEIAATERLKQIKNNLSLANIYANSYDRNVDLVDNSFLQYAANEDKGKLLSYLGNDPSQTEGALKSWAQQLQARIAPINEAVSRISQLSAIPNGLSDTTALYHEAAKVGQQISTMYDEGITDTEEYIALQHKLLKIFDTIAGMYGGVKGSGAKDRNELNQWMYRSMKEDTGFDYYSGSLVNALYEGPNAIYGADGKKQSMRSMAANLLDYKSDAFTGSFGLEQDLKDLQDINNLLGIIEKRREQLFQTSATGAYGAEKQSVDALNESLQRKAQIEQIDNSGVEVAEENAETQAIQQQNQALQENVKLKEQSNAQGVVTVGGTSIGTDAMKVSDVGNTSDAGNITPTHVDTSAESARMAELKAAIDAVTTSVGLKTQAFLNEEQEVQRISGVEKTAIDAIKLSVDAVATAVSLKTGAFTTGEAEVQRVITSEIASLDLLEQKANTIRATLEGLMNNIKTGQSDIGAGLGNITVTVNQNDGADAEQKGAWALDTTVQSVKGTLDGIRSDIGNVISAIGNISAQTPTQNTNGVLATENTLSAIKGTVDAINSKVVQGTKGGSSNSGTNNSNPAQNPQGGNKSGGTDKLLDAKIDTQYSSLALLYTQLESTGKMTDTIKQKWIELNNSLSKVNDNNSFLLWKQELIQVKNAMQQIIIANNLVANEGKATFQQLIATTKLYNQMAIGAQKATTPELKTFYEQEANKLLIEQQRLLGGITLTQEQQAKFDALEVERQREINRLVAEQVGRDNQIKAAQMEAEVIRQLVSLYEQLGRAEAMQNTSEIARIEGLINTQRGKLPSVDYATQAKFDAAESKGYKSADEASIKRINALRKEIGALRSEADYAIDDGVKNAIQEEIKFREELISLQQQGLSMSAEEESYKRKSFAQATKDARKAATQARNEQKQTFNDYVKETQQKAGIKKADSAIQRGSGALLDAASIQGVSPEATQQVQQLHSALDRLNSKYAEIRNSGGAATPQEQQELIVQTRQVQDLTSKVSGLVNEYNRLSGDNVSRLGATTLGAGSSIDAYEQELTRAVNAATNGKATIKSFDAETKTLTYTLKTGNNAFTTYTAAVRHLDGAMVSVRGTTTKTMGVFQAIGKKVKEYSYYFTGSMMIYRAIAQVREGITAIKEIDTALTELKKVTDETEETYDRFLDTASKTAAKVGSTIKDVVSSTADWARLGYSMQDAAQLAESTQILMNVSEFTDISTATDSLISSIQAFKYTAEESMDVVDILNTIGNNYAISTSDLAQSLTKSSGSLVAANGTLEEAVALTATANTIMQDADVVGTALKTVAMRLRGTSTEELEEEGLDTDGAVESKSKLQSKIKGLAGVDILTDTGAYKSTYQILSEIADVWEDISDIDQAALLELLAGKRAGSVMSAILQNPELLKEAFESASDASGSAIKENETYLDSIQGRLDLLTNSVQTMWKNTLDSDFVKMVVDIGTGLIKVVDQLGLIPSILMLISSIIMIKNKMGPIAFLGSISDSISKLWTKLISLPKAIIGTTTATSKLTEQTLQQAVVNGRLTTSEAIRQATTNGLVLSQVSLTDAEALALLSTTSLNEAERQAIVSKLGLTSASKTLTLDTLQQAIATGKLTASEALHLAKVTGLIAGETALTAARATEILTTKGVAAADAEAIVTALGLDTTTKTLTADTIALAIANGTLNPALGATAIGLLATGKGAEVAAVGFGTLQKSILPLLILTLIIAAIYALVEGFDALIVTSEELAEELSDLKSELSSIESDIESINSELETTQERMAELIAMPSLSFTEQEELERLKAHTAELERQLELQEMLAENTRQQIISTTEDYIDEVWNSAWDYYIDDYGAIQKDEGWGGFWNIADDTKESLDESMQAYKDREKAIAAAKEIYRNWDSTSMWDTDSAVLNLNIDSEGWDAWNRMIALGDKETFWDLIEEAERANQDLAGNISTVFADENFQGLEYGMSDDINDFLDELYAYQYKWKTVQGTASKASAIASVFDSTASEEIQSLETTLKEIAENEDLNREDKLTQAKAVIDNINLEDEAYHRLKTTMDTVGISTEELARYFVQLSEAPDSSTFEGVIAQYQKGLEALNEFKNGRTVIFEDINGNIEEIAFDDLFDENGKAIDTQISKVMQGANETTRKEFATLVETVKSKSIDFSDAMERFSGSMTLAGIEIFKADMVDYNSDIFKDIADDIDGLINTVNELQSAFESVSDSIDLVNQALAEQEYSGRVSIETALNLMAATDDWNKILEIENGNIQLVDGAMEILTQTKLDQIKANIDLALAEVNAQLAQYGMAESGNTLALTLEESTNRAVVELSANLTYFSALIGEVIGGITNLDADRLLGASAYAENAKKRSLSTNSYNPATSSVSKEELLIQKQQLEAQKELLGNWTSKEFQDGWSSDKLSGGTDNASDAADKKAQDALDALLEKYERQIKNLDNQQTYLQNEIDRLEAEDKGISKSYYEEQIKLEEKKLALYQQERAELLKLQRTDEVADALWEVEHAIQESTMRMVEFRQSIIDLYKTAFDDVITAYDNKDDFLSDQQNYIDKYQELMELQGGTATAGGFQEQMAIEEEKMADNIKELEFLRQYLAEAMANSELKEGDEEWIEMQDQIRATEEAVLDNKMAIEEYREELKQLSVDAFELVRGAFGNKDTFLTNQQDYIKGYADLLEEQGIDVPAELYDKLIEIEQDKRANNVANLIDARQGLADIEAAGYTAADEEWQDAYQQVVELEKAVQDNDIAMAEYAKTVRDLDFEKFERFISRLDDITSEIDHIRSLLDGEDVAFEDGTWTEEGMTSLGLLYHQMELNKQKSAEYAKEIDELNAEYAKGSMSEQEYYERLQELKEGQWDSIEAYEDAKDAIVDLEEARIDMIEEGINKEIEAYQELIDLKHEELDAERDLYKFKKDVEKQTKDIASLQRRIASLSGSTDVADIAERRELEAQLYEAQEGLNDTYYDHSKDQQDQALDEEMEAYQEAKDEYLETLRETLENTEALISEKIQELLLNADVTLNGLNTISQEYGITLSDSLMQPWENASDVAIAFKTSVEENLPLLINEDGVITIFSTEAKAKLEGVFNAGGSAAKLFNTTVTEKINQIKVTVANSTSSLTANLKFPWTSMTGKDGPISTFSTKAQQAINGAINTAKNKANEMKNSLTSPWTSGTNAVNTFSTSVKSALNSAISSAKTAASQVSAYLNNIKVPSYVGTVNDGNGGGAGNGTGGGGGGTTKTRYKATASVQANGKNFSQTKVASTEEDARHNALSALSSEVVNYMGNYHMSTDRAVSMWEKSWSKKVKITAHAFAKGTTGTNKDQWAITDEPWLGDELVLVPTASGNLSYMRKGTGVIPADLTENLMKWGKLNPHMMGTPEIANGINVMSNYISKPEINLDIENFLKVDRVEKDTLPALEKLMDKKIETFARQLNYSLKKIK